MVEGKGKKAAVVPQPQPTQAPPTLQGQYFRKGELATVKIHTTDGQVIIALEPHLLVGDTLISVWGGYCLESLHVKRSSVKELHLCFNMSE